MSDVLGFSLALLGTRLAPLGHPQPSLLGSQGVGAASWESPGGISEPLWASLGLSGLLWASLGISGPFWASQGISSLGMHQVSSELHGAFMQQVSSGLLSGPLWASLGLSGSLWALSLSFPLPSPPPPRLLLLLCLFIPILIVPSAYNS